jgi:hypothetical protein
MRELILFVTLTLTSGIVAADEIELKTACNDCSSPYSFGLHGVASLEALWSTKSFFEQQFGQIGITPITVHNGITGSSARIQVSVSTTNSVSLGLFSFGLVNRNQVSAHVEMIDGTGSSEFVMTEAIVERTIKKKGIEDSDVTECAKAECAINREYEEGRTIENFTWPIEASVMGSDFNIYLNQMYRFDGYLGHNNLHPPRRRPGSCWGTATGTMCEPDSDNSRPAPRPDARAWM